MTNCNCIIYLDALSLLLSDKTDIKAEIHNQMQQSDYEINQIKNNLDDSIIDAFDECSIDDILEFITIDEGNITFDYEESQACGNLRCVAFNIPMRFDEKAFAQKHIKTEE